MTGLLFRTGLLALGTFSLLQASSAQAQSQSQSQYRQKIPHSKSLCTSGAGPAILITITDIESSTGTLRVQSYYGTKQDWLQKGRWLNRIEVPASAGTMVICMPISSAGTYGIAVRHDVNGNGKTDISKDGGAMSRNPSLNIFNLGKPSYKKTAFKVGKGITPITIRMRYF